MLESTTMKIKKDLLRRIPWLKDLSWPFGLYQATDLLGKYYPPFPPDLNIVICDIETAKDVQRLADLLRSTYPPQHPVQAYWVTEKGKLGTMGLCLDDLSKKKMPRFPVDVKILGREVGTAFEDFAGIISHLRAPGGCPWDRKQTHLSLRPHLLEEAYEVLQALDSRSPGALREELGDLLLQIVLHAQIASEGGRFNMTDVIQGIYKKIVHRHPHVFGTVEVEGVEDVLTNWEKLKDDERRSKPGDSKQGLLEGVPNALPALTQAQEYQDRAARVGFDWKSIEPVLDNVNEELHEVRTASTPAEIAHELGDLLFAVVNYIRWFHFDAESLLRDANRRFSRRFHFIEETAKLQKKHVSELTFEEMDLLWEQAKKRTKKRS
jgi:tetrapyrrole methylase family protein/MazG family protein